ncbi:MAG: glycosyltransferase, partial [Cyanobacteria bacterium P01_H01_bin.26]
MVLIGSWSLRGLIAWLLPPGFDEAYYFLYTQHWDWSYFDHPVMVAITTAVGPWLTGVISPLTLRLGALALYGVSTGLL